MYFPYNKSNYYTIKKNNTNSLLNTNKKVYIKIKYICIKSNWSNLVYMYKIYKQKYIIKNLPTIKVINYTIKNITKLLLFQYKIIYRIIFRIEN